MKILLFGATGKVGAAIIESFGPAHEISGLSTKDFDASDFGRVAAAVAEHRPDAVINAAAYLGTKACEEAPEKAQRLNALLPKFLSELCAQQDLLLVHMSTDAVFDGQKNDFYVESDAPRPLNMYAYTKFGGDSFVAAHAKRHYIFRVPLLFGATTKKNQIIERLLAQAEAGAASISVSEDMFFSPTYALDAAAEMRRAIEMDLPSGLYHVTNAGRASLHDLMSEIVAGLGLRVRVEKAAHKSFRLSEKRSLDSTLKSEKLPALRPWRDAVKDYCARVSSARTAA